MKFEKEKTDIIKIYILEKIDSKSPGVARTVAKNFEININTVHTYLNEMLDAKIIEKVKRDEYRIIENEHRFTLSRDDQSLQNDMYAYTRFVEPLFQKYPKNVEHIWAYAVSEMVNNVIDHSGSENAEIVVYQDYLKTRILLTDHGIGIFRKIKDHFGYDSLDDAIVELFKGKLTTDSKNHSGEGIFFTSKLMDRFCAVSDGRAFSCGRFDDGIITDISSSCKTGTCIMMELSNFSNKGTKDVFDDYQDEDYNFSKTKIPVKNLFDGGPISRSQAKRLTNRLEKFSEIVIDFDGVEWMGQGFAHQLFSAFAKEHPELRLIPVNMNEDTEKMYRHVLNHDM